MHTFYIHVNIGIQTHLQMNTYSTYIHTCIPTQYACMYGVQDVRHKVWSAKYRAQSVGWPIMGHIINVGRKV